jgi:hypothetical protein
MKNETIEKFLENCFVNGGKKSKDSSNRKCKN